jgi:hypothetical protein
MSALRLLAALAILSLAPRAEAQCAEVSIDTEVRVELEGAEWPPALAGEMVRELAATLRSRALTPCLGARGRARGVALEREPSGVIRIRVYARFDEASADRSQLRFDPAELPPELVAFTLARAVNELLELAAVIPTEAEPIEEAREEEVDPPAPPPVSHAPGLELSILGAAHATAFTTEDWQFGGALGLRARWDWIVVALEAAASTGLPRSGTRGAITASLFGGSAALLARVLSAGEWALAMGPMASVFAASFTGSPNDESIAANAQLTAVVLLGARLELALFPLDALAIVIALDGRGVLRGAEGRDDLGALSRIDGAAFTLSIGAGAVIE